MPSILKTQSVIFAQASADAASSTFYRDCIGLANGAQLPVLGSCQGVGVMCEPGSEHARVMQKWQQVRGR